MSHHVVKGLFPRIPPALAGTLRLRAGVEPQSPEIRVPEVGGLTAGIRRRCATAPLSPGHWAAVAHDLRSHLNAIVLSTETVRLKSRSGLQIDLGLLLSRIERNARFALGLIDSSASPQAQLAERGLSIAAVQLGALAHEAVDVMQPLAERAGIRLELQADDGVFVPGDRIRLGRVLSNLLANAIRHSPKNGSIDIVVSRRGPMAVCHVTDRGPGVPAAERTRIFERRFQGGIPGAAGLGLFICREIVEEHGGRIWVEEHFPQGARFVFAIPLARNTPTIQPERTGPAVTSSLGQRFGETS